MQALKDAGIVLVVIILLVSVRVTKFEPAESAENTSLMPRVEAAAEALPASTPATPERCREMLFQIEQGDEETQTFVVVLETEEETKTKPCPRT